jgi:hypothetical protein
MSLPGPWYIDDALTFYTVTQRFDTGAATDADSVPAYRVYEHETATPIATGNMALLDSSNTAGLYSEQLTLSMANGFEVGKSYGIYIAATVNSVAGAIVEHFKVIATASSGTSVLDAAGVRSAVGLATASLDLQANSILNKTNQLTFTVSGKVDATLQAATDIVAAVANKIADHFWRRSYANAKASADGDALTFRSGLGAIAAEVNKASISGATMTITHEDDSTTFGTRTVVTAAGNPISSLDTV